MPENALKNNRKKVILHFALIVFPLFFGLLIYLLSDTGTYVSSFVFRFIPPPGFSLEKKGVFAFLRKYFCDFCWAFSLESCVSMILPKLRRYFTVSSLVSFGLSVLMEVLQAFHLISGKFDFIDIGIEAAAVLAAGLTIYLLIWRVKK